MPAHETSRREFLIASLATAGVAAIAGFSAAASYSLLRIYYRIISTAMDPPKAKIIHIIGHSHIDAAWLWPWRDGSNIALTTFRSALDRMNETRGFRYSHSSAVHYRWIQRAYPKMFEEIRQRVKEGRLEIIGGWPVEPDCNIPSTESLVRHCLYGKEYFQHALGVDVNIGSNPDSFGHAAGLPSILAGAGYRYYVLKHPDATEMKNLPMLFWWEAPDGSRVLALRVLGYGGKPERIPVLIEKIFAPGFNYAAVFLGVGGQG